MSDPLDHARQAIAREDADAAVALLLPMAQAGDVEAQFLLGDRFSSPVDLLPLADAIEWLRRASAAGHAEATYELALFRGEDEDGTHWGPPTTTDAVALLVRAGELRSVEAQYDLGALYATGDWAGPTDAVAARAWYRRAAEQGLARAQANLGGMFLDGEGGAIDVTEGLYWLEAAAAQDHPGALQRLAWVYTDGLPGVPADPERAAEYRRREEAAGWGRGGETIRSRSVIPPFRNGWDFQGIRDPAVHSRHIVLRPPIDARGGSRSPVSYHSFR